MSLLIDKIDKALESKASIAKAIEDSGEIVPKRFSEFSNAISDAMHKRIKNDAAISIDDDRTEVLSGCFENSQKLHDVKFMNATVIGERAFANSSVRNVIIPKATSIGKNAFQGCDNLAFIDISESFSISDLDYSLTSD